MISIEVNDISIQIDKIILHISKPLSKEEASLLQAAGRMLANSDQLAFIYLLEDDERYQHVSIPEHLWAELTTALRKINNVYIELASEYEIECTYFKDEFNYLLENIQDNSNYGDKMVEAVGRIISK
ncbi:hypothetical protein [Alkalihalobacterium alkalinitrilicum]|uniref:UPF0738 family protein n=1 Tax=Alkalihalobacterium alkalinitrilicum TaxID=427920 RepID=UPI000994DF53|nr:hypothetical protein [Alkalihalobacterium alkalinitrilicum]